MSNKLLEAQLKAQAAAEAAIKLQEELQAQLEAAKLAAEQAQRELEEAQESIRIREEEVRKQITEGISDISTKLSNFKEIIWSIPPQLTLNFIANLSDFSDKDVYLLINTNKQGKLNLEITSYTITLIDELNEKLSDINFAYIENQNGEYILTKNERTTTRVQNSSQQEIQFDQIINTEEETQIIENSEQDDELQEEITKEITALTDFENLTKDEFGTVILDEEIPFSEILKIEESLDLTKTIIYLEFEGKHLYKIVENSSIAQMITRSISPNKPLTVLSSLIKRRRVKSTLEEILIDTNSDITYKNCAIILAQQIINKFNNHASINKRKVKGKKLKRYQLIIERIVFENLFTDTLNQLNSSEKQLESENQANAEITTNLHIDEVVNTDIEVETNLEVNTKTEAYNEYSETNEDIEEDLQEDTEEDIENYDSLLTQGLDLLSGLREETVSKLEPSSNQEETLNEQPLETNAIDAILTSTQIESVNTTQEEIEIQKPSETNVIDAILTSTQIESVNTTKEVVEKSSSVEKSSLEKFEERLIKALKGKTRR